MLLTNRCRVNVSFAEDIIIPKVGLDLGDRSTVWIQRSSKIRGFAIV